MAKDTTTDNEKSGKQSGEDDRGKRVVAAEKKPAKKKAAKKAGKKKAVTKKKSTASSAAAASASAPEIAVPQPAATPAPKAGPAFAAPTEDEHSGGSMRGIVALWGPLAIIVLLIVVSRVNDEQAVAPGGLTASLESAESTARGVVEDVQDALSGGDPQAAAALETGVTGQSVTGDSKSALAAAFDDSGVNAVPGVPKPAATAAAPWGPSDQTTTPASVSGIPAALPPDPENPWAPVDPRALTAMPGSGAPPGPGYGAYGDRPAGAMHQGYPPQGQGYPPQGQGYAPHGQGYAPQGQGYAPQGQGYAPQGQGYAPQGQAYAPQGQGYPPQGQGYAPHGQGYPPRGQGYGQAYPRQQAYGSPPPYAYPAQPYATPPPYGPGYNPPAQ
jgi:hypothetical protein